VDADNSFGDVAAMLDLRPDRTIVDLVRDVDTVEREGVNEYLTRHSSGLWVLPAPREGLLWRSVQPDRFRKVVGLLSRRFDIVLVDTAGSLNDLALAALEEANMVLWVTSSDYSSINNSVIGLETLQQLSYPDSRIRLMLNVISPDDAVRAGKIEEVLGRKFFWSIPYDRQVRLDGQVGRPAVLSHPDCRGAKSITELGQALMGSGTAATKPAGTRQPGLRKLFSRRGGEASSAPAAEGS
jgi:pilus assembly protein CpaE